MLKHFFKLFLLISITTKNSLALYIENFKKTKKVNTTQEAPVQEIPLGPYMQELSKIIAKDNENNRDSLMLPIKSFKKVEETHTSKETPHEILPIAPYVQKLSKEIQKQKETKKQAENLERDLKYNNCVPLERVPYFGDLWKAASARNKSISSTTIHTNNGITEYIFPPDPEHPERTWTVVDGRSGTHRFFVSKWHKDIPKSYFPNIKASVGKNHIQKKNETTPEAISRVMIEEDFDQPLARQIEQKLMVEKLKIMEKNNKPEDAPKLEALRKKVEENNKEIAMIKQYKKDFLKEASNAIDISSYPSPLSTPRKNKVRPHPYNQVKEEQRGRAKGDIRAKSTVKTTDIMETQQPLAQRRIKLPKRYTDN